MQTKQSLRLFTAVTNYRKPKIISHRFDKKIWDIRSRSTWIEPSEKLSEKNGQTMFELVRRIQNIDVFKKNLIRAAADLVEKKLLRSQRFAFSEDKIRHFQSLDLYHKPIHDNSNFRSFSMRPQKLKNNLTYPSASGCAESKIAPNLTSRPVDLFWQSMKIVYNIFLRKSVVRKGKKW